MAALLFGSKPKSIPISINLAPKDPFFETPIGKILKWALSVGRYIVIFTELIVILSFVSRFTLDRQVTDLNDSLNQKKVIIESFGSLENKVRTYQAKIDAYQQVKQESNLADTFPVLSRITPRDVVLEQLRISQNQVSIVGVARSNAAFNTLVTNLELSPEFVEVNIGSVGSGDEENPGISFSVDLVVAQSQASNTTQSGDVVDVPEELL